MAQKQKLERKLGKTLVSRDGKRARSRVIGPSLQAAEKRFSRSSRQTGLYVSFTCTRDALHA